MIGVFNTSADIVNELSKFFTITSPVDFPKIKGLFIDFVDKNNSNYIQQGAILEYYLNKKIPIIIFDRYLSITYKEYTWLKKFKVFLFEPAINNRSEFTYLPQWFNKDRIIYRGNTRHVDIGYFCKNLNLNINSFETYLLEYAKLYPDSKIQYSTNLLKSYKQKEYFGFIDKCEYINFYDTKFTLALDNQQNYNIGYLNKNVFNAIYNGCLPMLPVEHKYFHCMFKNLVVSNIKELNFYVKSFSNISEIAIDDIVDNIEKYYPEFTLSYATDIIKLYLEK